MTVNHAAVAAIPTVGNTDKVLLRNLLTARMAYVLADAEDSRNLVAVDPATAAVIVDLVFLGRDFHYDPTDTTTAHDGTSCLVSSDGLRYKLAQGTDVFAYAVLDNTIAAPPGSPTIGDAYLVAAAATGAWSGKSDFIAVFTKRGWEFINFGIGRFIYVESIETYYHKDSSGDWVVGLGNQIFAAKSVPLSAAINFGARVIVENQTTTAPPGSPTVGTAYVIGPSATGAWAGNDGKLAICEIAGSFVIYTPVAGWLVYDKVQQIDFKFDGSAWVTTGKVLKRINSSGGTYNITAADNGCLLSFYGGGFHAVLFPSGSTLPASFSCTVFNEETTPVGKGIGGATNLGSFTLYPTQSYDIVNNNGNIVSIGGLQPYASNSVALFVHATNGSDDPLVADGLADSSRAFKTKLRTIGALYGNFLHMGSQPHVTLTGTFAEHSDFAGQPPGCGVFFWNGSAPGAYQDNYTSNGSCWTIGDGCVMEFSNVTFEGGGTTAVAIQMHQTAIADLLSGVVFNNFGGGSHVSTDGAGFSFNIDASYTIGNGGNASTHWNLNGNGICTVSGGITITINGGPAAVMSRWVSISGAVLCSLAAGITFIGIPAVGAQQWVVGPQGWLSRSGNTIPGSVGGVPTAGSAPAAGSGWVT